PPRREGAGRGDGPPGPGRAGRGERTAGREGAGRFDGPPGRGPMGPPSPERFVEHAMEFDADKDGKLDKSELMKFAEQIPNRMGRLGGRPGDRPPGDRPPGAEHRDSEPPQRPDEE
ncbi:MAG: hypothetical protein KDB01_11040, partial [Planctomycetaceae bacterium]|nr:hypothetical protein [Planctomycetaceae bacterium]